MNNLILIGYMGCGKSTVGMRLSYKLRRTFLDTDKEIERRQNCSISDIFATQGESVFRTMETEYLESLVDDKELHIVSTGGGMVLREENRALLKKIGAVVYLRAKPETIWKRLEGDTTRPLLQTENPKERISAMIEKRGPVYEEVADYIIDVDDKAFEDIVGEIVRAVEGEK